MPKDSSIVYARKTTDSCQPGAAKPPDLKWMLNSWFISNILLYYWCFQINQMRRNTCYCLNLDNSKKEKSKWGHCGEAMSVKYLFILKSRLCWPKFFFCCSLECYPCSLWVKAFHLQLQFVLLTSVFYLHTFIS